jgi:sphingomyelin phosphodiesterase acid-like 3
VELYTLIWNTETFLFCLGTVRHGMDLLFINHTETPINYHALANSSHYIEAMDTAGRVMKNLTTILHEYFPDTQVIVSVGNNDVVPDYYLELKEENSALGNLSLSVEDAGMLGVLYDALNDNSTKNSAILTRDDEWTFLRGGYYSRMLHDGKLIILSLNTVLFASYYEPEPSYEDDPGKQFLWMKKMLGYAKERKCQVIIIGHIPPTIGSFRHNQFWKDDYIKTYYTLIEGFDDVVIAQLFGHLHSDEFRVGDLSMTQLNSDTETHMIPSLSSPLLLGPSVTPIHGNHPAFRLVKYGSVVGNEKYNDGRFKLLDYESYSSLINTDQTWEKLYTFSDVYASSYTLQEGLSAKTMRSVVEAMENTIHRQESAVLSSFRAYVKSGASGSQYAGFGVACDEQCKEEWICTIISATRNGFENCLVSRCESREKAKGIIAITVFAIVGAVVALAFVVRTKRASKRSSYEETPSVEGGAAQPLEIDKC